MTGRFDLALAFVVAAVAHAGALGLGANRTGGGGAGDGGSDRISLEAASPSLEALVRDWDRSPETSRIAALAAPGINVSVPRAPSTVDAPSRAALPSALPAFEPAEDVPAQVMTAAPDLPAPAIAAVGGTAITSSAATNVPRPVGPGKALADTVPDRADLAAAVLLPTPGLAPRQVARPAGRPEASPASPTVARRVATGIGQEGKRGDTRPQTAPKVSDAVREAAASSWAAAIQGRIARHHSYPTNSRAEGRVRVAMVILPDGRLDRVRVARTSGTPALDEAAIAAVRRAAPFPPAPDALTEKWFDVGQWITFERR